MKNNISIVSITDFSDYEEGKSNTGGKYAYNTTYAKIGENKWEVSYSTTADFEYCEICGSFGHNREDCQWQSDNEIITTEELDDIILKLVNDADIEIAYK